MFLSNCFKTNRIPFSSIIFELESARVDIPEWKCNFTSFVSWTKKKCVFCRNETIPYCFPYPDIPNYAKYSAVVKSLIYYIIPLMVIACFYVLMAIRLHTSANEMPGEIRGAQGISQAKARKHVARMVLIFVFRKYELWKLVQFFFRFSNRASFNLRFQNPFSLATYYFSNQKLKTLA